MLAGVWPQASGLGGDLGGQVEGHREEQMQGDSAHTSLGIGWMVGEIRNQRGAAGVREEGCHVQPCEFNFSWLLPPKQVDVYRILLLPMHFHDV